MRVRARRKDLPAPVRKPRTDLHACFWMMRFCMRFAVTCRAKKGRRFISAVSGKLSGAVGSGMREHVADLGGELFQREGFGQEGDIAIGHAVMADSISGIAGRV